MNNGIKRLLRSRILLTALILALSVAACYSLPRSDALLCSLEDKYAEKFVIINILEKNSSGMEAVVAAENHPRALFEAKLETSEGVLEDEYVASRVSEKISLRLETALENFLTEKEPSYVLHTEAISKSINSSDADMSVREFMEKKPSDEFMICVLLPEERKEDLPGIQDTIRKGLEDFSCIRGEIQIVFADAETMRDAGEFFAENAKFYYDYDRITKNAETVAYPFPETTVGP